MGCKVANSIASVWVSLVLARPVLAQQAPLAEPSSDASRAAVAFQRGRELFFEGHLAEGCALLGESYRLDPVIGTLLTLEACHEAEGRYGLARAELAEAERRVLVEGRNEQLIFIRQRKLELDAKATPASVMPVEVPPSGAVAFSGTLPPVPAALPTDVAPSQPIAALRPLPESSSRDRLRLGGLVHFGGEVQPSVNDFDFGEKLDAETTLGFLMGYDVPLNRNFMLGGEAQVSWWNTESSGFDSSVLLAVLAKFSLRHPIVLSEGALAELYLTLPIGFHINFTEHPLLDNGAGFSVGGAAGASYWFAPAVALFAHFGGLYHALSAESSLDGSDVEGGLLQWGVQAGLQFAL